MKLNIIVAVDEMGGFGKDGKIPWDLPEDMKHFKETTEESICVMGRNTYEDMVYMRYGDDIPTDSFEVLPNRTSYVISNSEGTINGAEKIPNLRVILDKYRKFHKNVFILGGQRLFVEALSHAPNIYMTIIKGKDFNCDTFFPIESLKGYKIAKGKETDTCYFLEYRPI